MSVTERQRVEQLIESLLQEEAWAAEQITRYLEKVNDWRKEWTRLHELRLSWVEKIAPRPPAYDLPVMQEPITFEFEEV